MIPFTKMHGIGNDYVYVNGFETTIDDPAALARVIVDRHRGVGGDGLIVILPSDEADVRMQMFNADGSESEMCGNGVRCVCKFAHDHELSRAHPMRIETGRGVLTLEYTVGADGRVDRVTVDMGEPILTPAEIPVVPANGQSTAIIDAPFSEVLPAPLPAIWLEAGAIEPRLTCVSTGNPHAIVYAGRVADAPLEEIGPAFETMSIFPRRVNLHLVEVHRPGEVTMRTWERGSGITQACGTGASAVCVAGVLTGRTSERLLAHLPGGDLELAWKGEGRSVFMTGPAVEVFSGVWGAGVASVGR